MNNLIAFLLVLATFLSSCTNDKAERSNTNTQLQKGICASPSTDSKTYFFTGHLYKMKAESNKVDKRLEWLDFSCYDQIWLGGDVCLETTKNKATLGYLDSLFNLSKQGNMWALGNHDVRNGNLDWIEEKTRKNDYHSEYINGITVATINTNFEIIHKDDLSRCDESQQQLDFLQNIIDTITPASSHFVLMMHHVLWSEEIHWDSWHYTNHYKDYWRFSCDSSTTFYNSIYPQLIQLEQKGIEVICLAGDAGLGVKKGFTSYCDYKTDDGIQLLANGLVNSNYSIGKRDSISKDKIILFTHSPKTKSLTWKFHDLDSLVTEQMIRSNPNFKLEY